jgi:hypothetical protein
MVNARIATGAEQPINRDAGLAGEVANEGDLVGMDSNGKIVLADAATGTAINAIGILAAPVDDLSNYSGSIDLVQSVVEAERVLVDRDRVAVISYGVLIENSDEDWGFTPGQPVYLAEGGGYTQTPPSDAGDLDQCVGMATEDGETVFINVQYDYTTV